MMVKKKVHFSRLLAAKFLTMSLTLLFGGLCVQPVFGGEAIYFAFQDGSNLPADPSSILLQSPSFVDVPAGAVLRVHLMRGDESVAVSRLTFAQAFRSESLIPPAPLASFLPTGSTTTSGQPLPNATLDVGLANLQNIAAAPGNYRFLWELSAGVMGTPGRAVVTGVPTRFVDLKLCAVSAATLLGDQKPGSVLFYNRYISNATNSNRENTAITLTNTHPTQAVSMRLYLVNGATCEVSDFQICLAAQQTASFLLSDLDPGVRGYLMAVAVDATGKPTQFNWLIGNAALKQAGANGTSLTAVLNAYTVAKRAEGAVAPNANNVAELIFDDAQYDRLPAQLAFDGVASPANGTNSTTLSFYRPLPDLTGNGTVSATVQITGKSAQNPQAAGNGTVNLNCFTETSVSLLRLAPLTIANLIPAGTTGWFTASTSDLQPLLGSQFNSGTFSGGTNARALSFSAEYRIKLAVSAPTCGQ